MNGGVATAWLAELIVLAYRGGHQLGKTRPIAHLALPAEYASSFVIYGALSLVPEGPGARVAGLVGWGIVVATVLNLWSPPGVPGSAPTVKQTQPFVSTGAPSNKGVVTL